MKKYVLILLITKDYKKVLLVKRKKEPYINLYNGIGGKIEYRETVKKATIRECYEETGIKITNPKLLVSCIYPKSINSKDKKILHVLYDFVDQTKIPENYEGVYEWKDILFGLDSSNKEIAGLANLSQFLKEILDQENIKKFYQ